MSEYCQCSTNCLSSKGRSVCVCRANGKACNSLCKCGTKLECSNGKSISEFSENDFQSNLLQNKSNTKKRKAEKPESDFSNKELQPPIPKKPSHVNSTKPKAKRVNTAAIRDQQNEILITQLGTNQLRGVLWAILKSKRLFLKDYIEEGNEKGLLKPIMGLDEETVSTLAINNVRSSNEENVVQASSQLQENSRRDIETLGSLQFKNPDENDVDVQNLVSESETSKSPTDPDGPPPPPNGNNQPKWCKCNKCIDMPTQEERRCCASRRDTGCITNHELFPLLCLHRAVLETQLQLRFNIAAYEWENNNDCFRYAAYRQFICWRYGRLGVGQRRVIPACVVHAIRIVYPKTDRSPYTGFKAYRPLM